VRIEVPLAQVHRPNVNLVTKRPTAPQRSLCIQYHESDLQFVQRLLREEGLFCWFEHEADASEALGKHTLVIADHNGAFQPNAQPRVRYTQSAAASFREAASRASAKPAASPTAPCKPRAGTTAACNKPAPPSTATRA
jgi:uncharacterized protein involved in type VI secretion and phage assembly